MLTVAGLAVSGYLLARVLSITGSRSPAVPDICAAVFGMTCDPALVTGASVHAGIPLAAWGVVYYGTLFGLFFLAWVLKDEFSREARIGALLLSAAAAIASFVLSVPFVRGRVPVCPLCLLILGINLALVPAIRLLCGCSIREVAGALGEAARYAVGGSSRDPRKAAWRVVAFVTAGLVGLALYQWSLVEWERRVKLAAAMPDEDHVLADFDRSPVQNIVVSEDDPRLGPAGAPLTLVVFSSFQCKGCQTFAHETGGLMEHARGKMAIVFKHFPLSVTCNPALKTDLQSRACDAAWAAEAARLQGGFWPFHDALFASDDLGADEKTLLRIARDTHLDLARFEEDRAARPARARVLTDIEQGLGLGVDATPALFLNGRRVSGSSLEILEILIEHEVKAGGK